MLSQFPHNKLLEDLDRTEQAQTTTVIVQIDEDTRGEIFGAPWEIGPALVWMYPELRGYLDTRRLAFLVGRESEWSTAWDGDQIIQKWCGNNPAVVSTAKARRVSYVRLGIDGSSRYDQYVANLETGCRKLAPKPH